MRLTITRAVSGFDGSVIQFASFSRGFRCRVGSSGAPSGSRIPSGRGPTLRDLALIIAAAQHIDLRAAFSDHRRPCRSPAAGRHLVFQRLELHLDLGLLAIRSAAHRELHLADLLLDRSRLRLPGLLFLFAGQHEIVAAAVARSEPASGSNRTGGTDRTCDRGSARIRR